MRVASLAKTNPKSDPIHLFVVVVIALTYLLPGLVGHDPWKADEGYTFGNIYDLLKTGDWVVPHLAGEPFMEKPPLYHLVGAAMAALTSPLLPVHDGARLASGLFMAITVVAVAWSAHRSIGDGNGRIAVLMTLSAVGLLVHAHMMVTDLALMAGFATATAGLVGCSSGRPIGGVLLGTGAGMAFLSKGLIGPGAIVTTSVFLPIAFANWRNAGYLRQLVVAAIAAMPWFVIWPFALYLRSPELFSTWIWDNNIGRFVGFSVSYLGARHETGFWWRTYPWFLFPLWLFILPLLYRANRATWREPAAQIGGTLAATTVAVLACSASAREIYALPILPPLALLATAGIAYRPRLIDRSLTVLGLTLTVGALFLFWFCWYSLVIDGVAPNWSWLIQVLPQRFSMPKSFVSIAAAGAFSVGALTVIIHCWTKTGRGLLMWSSSLALGWALSATLWLPWLDYSKTYRAVYQSMWTARIDESGCIASQGLGESERAMLEYTLQVVTERMETVEHSNCDMLLTQGTTQATNDSRALEWRQVWSGHRPGDLRERFKLFVRDRTSVVPTIHARRGTDMAIPQYPRP